MDEDQFQIHVLLRLEIWGERCQYKAWVAQCLEYDIVAQGDTIPMAKNRFVQMFLSHISLARKHGQRPFQNMTGAPQKYQERYQHGEELRHPLIFDIPQSRQKSEALLRVG
jgi:hypothetical protein